MEFKRLSDVEVVAEPAESANVLIEENGVIKKAPKTAVGGNGEWDAIIDLGADTETETLCALWQGHHANARFISGSYDTIVEKFNNNEIPNILCYGTVEVYDDFYTFKSKVDNITMDLSNNNISLGYHAFNLCNYTYGAYITINSSNECVNSDNSVV